MIILLFDFDGTIANSVNLSYDCIKNRKNGEIPKLSLLRNQKTESVLSECKLNFFDIFYLIWKVRKVFRKKITEITPQQGLAEALNTFSQNNCKMYTVSSNSKENVISFLEMNNLSKYFSDHCSLHTVLGKYRGMDKFIRKNKLDKKKIVYIGDETRDIELASKLKIKSCGVSWGYNTKKILASLSPDFIADKPSELLCLC